MKIFESHAHYDDERFDEDREKLLEQTLPNAGVEYVINISAELKSVDDAYNLARKYDYVYCTVGIHPHYAHELTDADIDMLYNAAKRDKVVAIGEIGLDCHYEGYDKEAQINRFKQQLELAKAVNKPVIIHSRDAAQETFEIIKESGAGALGGSIHCYSGSAEMAREYVKLGFHIGIGGVITYKNARALIETAKSIPLERILIETDCPYLPPEPHRGERNDSSLLPFIINKLAEVRGEEAEAVAEATYNNGVSLFLKGK